MWRKRPWIVSHGIGRALESHVQAKGTLFFGNEVQSPMDLSKPTTMTTSVNLSTRTREQPQAHRRAPGQPFRILLLGDFSGSSLGANQPASSTDNSAKPWRPRRIDIDNWQDVLNKIAPHLQLPLGSTPTEISFHTIDDFHPDTLYEKLPLFQQFRQWRRQLMQSSTFADAAREVRQWAELTTGEATESEPQSERNDEPVEKSKVVDSEDLPAYTDTSTSEPESAPPGLLDELLSRPVADHELAPRSSLPDRRMAESWEAALRKIVLPYCVEAIAPDRDALVASVDSAAEKLMRMLLHDPSFQELESLWRGVEWFLKEEVDEDSPLEIHLADCSWPSLKEALAEGVAGDESPTTMSQPAAPIRQGQLASLLLPEPGTNLDQPRWQLVLGLFSVGTNEEDVTAMQRLGSHLALAQAQMILLAGPSVVGFGPDDQPAGVDDWPPLSSEEAQRWDELQKDSSARWLGLIWPRFLMRLPYGRRSHPCESLQFEERGEDWRHTDYLWANSALLWGAAVARRIADSDGEVTTPESTELGGMPLDVFLEEGEMVAHPCTEVMLGERDIAALLARGIMPALSIRNSDAIRLTTFRSLSGDLLPM